MLPVPFKINTLKPIGLIIAASLTLMACQPTSDPQESDAVDTVVVDTSVIDTNVNTSAPVALEHSKTEQNKISTIDKNAVDTNVAQVITQPITILALGDSLTEGLGVDKDNNYPAQLEEVLKEAGYVNATVINSGLSGETSTGLVNRLDWVLKTKPDITILTTGANDAMRGIEVATVDKNIRDAIRRLQAQGSVVILGGMQIYDNMGDAYVQEFTSIYPKIAEDTGVAFIPFFLEGVAGDATLNQADAIHPTREGYTRIVHDNILPVLMPTLESVLEN